MNASGERERVRVRTREEVIAMLIKRFKHLHYLKNMFVTSLSVDALDIKKFADKSHSASWKFQKVYWPWQSQPFVSRCSLHIIYMHNGWTTIKARKIGLKSCWARNSMPMHKKEPIEFKNITQKWDNCYCERARAANKMTACPNEEYKEILAWNSMWSCNENAQQIAIKRTKIVNKKKRQNKEK